MSAARRQRYTAPCIGYLLARCANAHATEISTKDAVLALRGGYSLEQAREPDLEGELQLQFTIDGEPKIGGIVTDNEIIGGSLSDRAELTTCIRETLFTLKFPAPEEGGSIVVQYPLAFAPSE